MPIHNQKQRPEVLADEPISVTVDASDLTVASAEPLRNIISRYGRPVVARAFADFQQPNLADLAVQLYQMGFTLIHCPTWPNGDGYPKSVVSDVMAQDLRDQLETLEGVETYLLVATSRDYIAVANALRRHDCRVVVVAEEAKVCKELRLCAEEFAILPPTRPERSVEAPRAGRSAETRVERPAETVRSEPQDTARLPTDAEVLAEVRRIVAAEGICTPRRLARALCPVDRTPTGELRSRIANRIQALIDSGKLQRERLVVGGTSVETILVREERNGKGSQQVAEVTPAAAAHFTPPTPPRESEAAGLLGSAEADGVPQASMLQDVAAEPSATEDEREQLSAAHDLDALVESVLRSPELAAGLLSREADQSSELTSGSTEPMPPEAPKRSRSRRRTSSSKTAASGANGAV